MQRLIDKDALLKMLKNDPLYDVIANKYNIEGAIESMPEADFRDYCKMQREVDYWCNLAHSYERTILKLCQVIGKDED